MQEAIFAFEDEGNFGAPFEPITSPPSYTPNEPLSTFDGMPSEGLWTVHVVTSPNFSPVGSFSEWGLIITLAGVPVGPCDCNENGVPDNEDIADGTSPDENGNGVPDECEGNPADLDGDGMVGPADLAILLGNWGPCGDCGNCPADLDGDCTVGATDLAILLGSWG